MRNGCVGAHVSVRIHGSACALAIRDPIRVRVRVCAPGCLCTSAYVAGKNTPLKLDPLQGATRLLSKTFSCHAAAVAKR